MKKSKQGGKNLIKGILCSQPTTIIDAVEGDWKFFNRYMLGITFNNFFFMINVCRNNDNNNNNNKNNNCAHYDNCLLAPIQLYMRRIGKGIHDLPQLTSFQTWQFLSIPSYIVSVIVM